MKMNNFTSLNHKLYKSLNYNAFNLINIFLIIIKHKKMLIGQKILDFNQQIYLKNKIKKMNNNQMFKIYQIPLLINKIYNNKLIIIKCLLYHNNNYNQTFHN
jgi:hypothetical protein